MPPRPGRLLRERLKRVTTKPAATEPAATALWLRPLLKSAEIEELRRTGSNYAEKRPQRHTQRNEQAASGKHTHSFWPVGHGRTAQNGEPASTIALRRYNKSQIIVKCYCECAIARLARIAAKPEARAAFCMSREEFYLRRIPFGMDGPSLAHHDLAMGQINRLTCPKCGAKLIAAPSPSANELRALSCPDCDCLDPFKSERAMGWLKSELQPPTR